LISNNEIIALLKVSLEVQNPNVAPSGCSPTGSTYDSKVDDVPPDRDSDGIQDFTSDFRVRTVQWK